MASSGSIKAGSAYVELLIRDSSFIKGLQKASSRLKTFGEGISSIGTKLMLFGGLVTGPLAAMGKAFADGGSALFDMVKRTGMSAEALSELSYAAQQTGTDLDTVEKSVRKMQRSIVAAAGGSSSAAESFATLGIGVAKLAAMNPEEQFTAIADALSRVRDPAMRTALAMQIFGRAGAALLPMMERGAAGLDDFRQRARDLGLTSGTEGVAAAKAMGDAFTDLARVSKKTAGILGSAVAGTLKETTEWMTILGVKLNSLLKNNKDVIAKIFKIGKVIVGVGFAVFALGTVIAKAGVILGTLASAVTGITSVFGVFGSVLAVLLNPVTMIIAGLVALSAYLVYTSGVGAQALSWLGDRFTELKDFAVASFQGISDALSSGDIALAGKILWLTLKVTFEKGVGWLQGIWLSFRSFFISTAYDAFYGALAAWEIIQNGLSVAWIETTAFLSKTWTSFTSGFTQAWNDAINWTSKRLLELQGLFDSSLDVDAAKKMADQELAVTNAEIERKKQAALAEREQQRAAERQQAGKDHQGEMTRIGQESIDKQKALESDNVNRVKAAEDELAKAKQELQDAIAEARQKKQTKDANTPKRPGAPQAAPDVLAGLGDQLAAARQRTISVAGSFNAFEARGLGSGGVADRIAKAAEDTAKNTKKMLDELQNLDGSEFE